MANFVHIENGSITEYHDKLPKNWKNISGLDLMTSEERLSHGWYSVTNLSDAHNSDTHYIAGYTYDIFTDHVVQTPQIVAYTDAELIAREEQHAAELQQRQEFPRQYEMEDPDESPVVDEPIHDV